MCWQRVNGIGGNPAANRCLRNYPSFKEMDVVNPLARIEDDSAAVNLQIVPARICTGFEDFAWRQNWECHIDSDQ